MTYQRSAETAPIWDETLQIHTKPSWRSSDDRRASAVWLAIFWLFTGLGFGFDLKNFAHESPPVPLIVDIHAVVATIWLLIVTALVLLVEFNNVKFHRLLGWFASGFAVLVAVMAPWGQLSWQAVNLNTPGALPPEFLSIAFSSVVCFVILLPCGILLRKNPAAHRRVMILATIAMTDPGFSRLVGLFLPGQNTWIGQYLYFFGGNLFIMLLMFAWDWHKNRLMQQFLQGASLLLVVDTLAVTLYFNAGWKSFARHWVESWARHV